MTIKEQMAKMMVAAARGNDLILGRALGPRPSYFIIGDEPMTRDVVVGQPFSGPLGEVLTSAINTLQEKYGIESEDVYVTYLIKCRYASGSLTEKIVTDEWLPIAQTEYYLSGCSNVVAIGRVSRLFAGHISQRPSFIEPYQPTLVERVRQAWNLIRS